MTSHTPVTLDYSTPRCFFERAYSYRSFNAVMGIAAMLVFGSVAMFMARKSGAAAPAPPFKVAHVALWIIAGGCTVAAGWLVLNLLRGTSELSRITEEGIEQKGRVYRWETIARVGGSLTVGGVLVTFTTRGRGRGGVMPAAEHMLMMTPALRRDEFGALTRQLRKFLAEHHPHVKVERNILSD